MNDTNKTWKREWVLLLFILVFTLGLSLISIHVPFARDQGVAAYIGSMILSGKAPYKDVYHFNLPGIFFAYTIAFKIFGKSIEAVNLFDALYRAITLISVWALARRTAGWKTGLWAGCLYGVFSTLVYADYWDMAQKETFTILPLCLALLMAVSGGKAKLKRYLCLFLAGLFSAAACYFKPTLGLPFLVILGYLLLTKIEPAKTRIAHAGWMIAGFAMAWIPLIVYLVNHYAVQEFVQGVFIFGRFYGAQRYSGLLEVIGLPIIKTSRLIYEWRFLTAASIAGIIAITRSKTPARALIFFWGMAIYLNILVQMKFFTYHWIPLLAPLSLLAGRGCAELLSSLPHKKIHIMVWAVWVLAIFLFIGNTLPFAKRYKREVLYDFGLIEKEDFLKAYGKWGSGDICVRAELLVAEYIKDHTNEQDRLLVFSLEPGLNFFSGRPSPTRLAYDQPLTTDTRGNSSFASYQEKLRQEFMSDLEEHTPVYVVVLEHDTSVIEPHDSYQQMQEFEPFREWLYDKYYLETKIEHYYIFRLKPSLQGPAKGGMEDR
jgi:hypothetical protein